MVLNYLDMCNFKKMWKNPFSRVINE